MVRWDAPLFTVPWNEDLPPVEEMWQAVTAGALKPPNAGTSSVIAKPAKPRSSYADFNTGTQATARRTTSTGNNHRLNRVGDNVLPRFRNHAGEFREHQQQLHEGAGHSAHAGAFNHTLGIAATQTSVCDDAQESNYTWCDRERRRRLE